MNTKKALSAWTLALTVAVVNAAETRAEERFEVSFFGGHSFLDVSDESEPVFPTISVGLPVELSRRPTFRTSFTQGFEVGARFGYRFHDRVSIEAQYRYSPNNIYRLEFDFDCCFPIQDFLGRFGDIRLPPQRFGIPIELERRSDAHALDVNLLYYLTGGQVRPFVTGGLGTEILGLEDDKRSHFAWNVGGGLLWELREELGVRLDVRERFITDFVFTSETEANPAIQYSLVIRF